MTFKAGFLDDPVVRMLPGSWKSRPFVLEQDLVYFSEIADRLIVVPKGYKSDLLSIPWIFRRLFNKGGPGRRASIVHDWACDARPEWCPCLLAADIFLEAMRVDNVGKIRRGLMYYAVLYFGPRWP